MGKLTDFSIILTQPQGIYYAGQWLQGQVVINLSEEMKMRGIQLEMVGSASVHWSERHSTGSGKNRRTTTRHYRSNETYFNNNVILFGNSGGMFSDTSMHPAGNYSYPFQMQLPNSLPSSFEGAHGNVRYYIKCAIDRPWKFDHKTKRVFTVISQLDLNRVPDALISQQRVNTKTLCCWCCASGPIEATVRINRKGYVPGEDIPICAEISNGSNRSVSGTKAELIMTTRFHATSKSKSVTRIVAVKKMGRIEEGEHQSWNNVPLHIPPVPPSDLVGCRIIDVVYYIKFTVDPSGPATDMEVLIPVTIGTIPLTMHFDDYSAAAAAATGGAAAGGAAADGYGGSWYSNQPAAGFNPPPASSYPPSYVDPSAPPGMPMPPAPMPSAPMPPPGAPPNAPPPSYHESVFGRVETVDEGDNEYMMGDKSFAPKYAYYNWNNQAYALPEQKTEEEEE